MSEVPRIIKHWRIIRDHVPHWTPTQQLEQLAAWVRAGQRFYYTRFNDGECAMMSPTQHSKAALAKGQHRWERQLCKDMRVTFDEVLANLWSIDREDSNERLMVGSWWSSFRLGDLPPLEELAWLGGKIKDAGLTQHRWAWPDLWYSSFGETADCTDGSTEALLGLLKAIPSAVVIGNERIKPVVEEHGWAFVQVSMDNCWSEGPRVLDEVRRQLNEADDLAIWCCGQPAKVWAWKLWREGLGSHLDAGHLLDRAAGVSSRDWHERDAIHRREYDKLIGPWLRGEA